MFRRIVSYLLSFSIAFPALPLYATDPEVTLLCKHSAYRVQSDKGPVDCIDVKRSKTGEIQLSFDPSLHEENTKIYLVLDHQPIGMVSYLQNTLHFVGCGDLTFELQGKLKVDYLNVWANSLKLDVIGETIDIYVEAKKIIEAATNQLYASNSLTIKGYQDGFQHGGMLKAKSAIHFQGGDYTSTAAAQTLTGCLLQNKSKKTIEAGRVVAGLYVGQGEELTFLPSAHFLGCYFIPQIKGDLTLHTGSLVQVQHGAPLWAQGNVALNGNLNKIATACITFPHLELFGLETLKVATFQENKLKAAEINNIQAPIFNEINVSGLALQSEKDMLIGQGANLKSPDSNIMIEGFNVRTGGTIEGGHFEGLSTAIKAHFAQLLGGAIQVGDVSIDVKNLNQYQSHIIDAQRVQLTGEVHAMGGHVTANEYVQQTTQSIDIQEAAKINVEIKAQYVTPTMAVAGQLIAHGQSTTIVDQLTTTATAQMNGKTNDVVAKKGEHGGLINGENVHCKIDHLKETSTGQIKASGTALLKVKDSTLDGKNNAPTMHVSGNNVTVNGPITGENVSTDIQKLTQREQGIIAGTEQTTLMGEEARLHGTTGETQTVIAMSKSITTSEHSAQKGSATMFIKAPEIEHDGEAMGGQVTFEGDNVHIKEPGAIKSTQATTLFAHKNYANEGLLASEGNIYAEVPDAHALGKVKAHQTLTVKSQVQPDVNGIWSGMYPSLTQIAALHLIVPNSVQIFASPHINIKLGLTAPHIYAPIPLFFMQDGSLIANLGNLSLQDISGHHLHLESNGAVSFKRVTFTDGIVVRSGSDVNFCDHFIGNGTAQIEAPSISNPLNNQVAADILSMEATVSDIQNRGVMQGSKLLQRVAARDIVDEVTWGWTGRVPWFIPAQAIGGGGIEMTIDGQTRNVGLISKAEGMVRNIGSHVSTGANADAFLDGNYGIENISQAEKYLAESKTKKHGFLKHKTTHYKHWSNVLAESKECIGGCMFRSSKLGPYYTSGSLHAGQGEDVTNVYGPIIHAALILTDKVGKTKKKFCGMSHSSRNYTTQYAQITRYLNNGGIYHQSRTAELIGQGTYYLTPTLVLRSPTYIHFDGVVLNHSLRTKYSAFSPTISGIPLFGNHNINSIPGAALYQDLCYMGQSGADISRIVTGFQQTWSQITSLAAGFNEQALGKQILAQFAEIGFSFAQTKSSQKWQTNVPHTVLARAVYMIALEHVTLAGGAQIYVSQLFKAETPRVILSAARLESSSKQSSFKVGAGYNPCTWSGSFSCSSNRGSSHGIQYNYAIISAREGGKVDLGVMDYLGLLGANINCGTILGYIQQVDLATLQNEFRSKQTGWGVNLSTQFTNNTITNPTGGINLNMAIAHQKKATEDSGIEASEGLDDSFSIGQLNVEAKRLDAELAKQAKQVTFKCIHDVNKSHSFGISMQGLDLSSWKGLGNSLAKNTATLAAGAVAAEIGRAMRLNEQVVSALSMMTTAMVSQQINDYLGDAGHPPASGIGILGQLNYGHNGHQINVTGIDFSVHHFGLAAKNLERAVDKVFASEAPPIIPAPVLQLEEPTPLIEATPVEEKRPAIPVKEKKISDKSPKKFATKKQNIANKNEPSTIPKESSKKRVVHYFDNDPMFRLVSMEDSPDDIIWKSVDFVHIEPTENLNLADACLEWYLREKKNNVLDSLMLGSKLKSCFQHASNNLYAVEFTNLLTEYPLVKHQTKAINELLQVFARLGSDDKAPTQFVKQYRNLGWHLLYSWSGDDIMRLHLLSQIAERHSSLNGSLFLAHSTGKMPFLWSRETTVIGLIPRLLGMMEAIGGSLMGGQDFRWIGFDGHHGFINPAAHMYMSEQETLFDGASIGVTPSVATGVGRFLARQGSKTSTSKPSAVFPVRELSKDGIKNYDRITIPLVSGKKFPSGGNTNNKIKNKIQLPTASIDKATREVTPKAETNVKPVNVGVRERKKITNKTASNEQLMSPGNIRDLSTEDLGFLPDVIKFEAKLILKDKNTANITISNLEAHRVDLIQLFKSIKKIGKKTGAKTLELEGDFENKILSQCLDSVSRSKRYLMKTYHYKPRDFDWERLWKEYGHLPRNAEVKVNIYDKVTIPLTSGKKL